MFQFFVGMDVPRDLSGDGSDVRNEILELAQHLRQESLYIKNEKSQVRQKLIFCLYALFKVLAAFYLGYSFHEVSFPSN